jgi:hypothetical protein
MSKTQFILGLLFASVLGGIVALAGFRFFNEEKVAESFEQKQNVRFSSYFADTSFTVPEGLNFIYAAERVRPAVVHIKTSYEATAYGKSEDEDMEGLLKTFMAVRLAGSLVIRVRGNRQVRASLFLLMAILLPTIMWWKMPAKYV